MFKQIIFSFFIICSFVVNTFAQKASDDDLQLNTITTSLPFMSITPDSRSGAMGDVGTALSASSSSIFWNTAMLNFAEKTST